MYIPEKKYKLRIYEMLKYYGSWKTSTNDTDFLLLLIYIVSHALAYVPACTPSSNIVGLISHNSSVDWYVEIKKI